jgi:hypothetical protein
MVRLVAKRCVGLILLSKGRGMLSHASSSVTKLPAKRDEMRAARREAKKGRERRRERWRAGGEQAK